MKAEGKRIVCSQNYLLEPQALQHFHTLPRVALIVMQLKDRVFDFAKKVAIVLDECQLGTLDVALQEIDLGPVLH
jgi:hypothetical protein